MKKILGLAISAAVLFGGALGNYHLYKEAGDVASSMRNIIVLIMAIGMELAILVLIHTLAREKNETVKIVTGWLIAVTIPVSLIGQYSYLIKEASSKTEAAKMATGNLDTLATQTAALMASKVAMQGERASMVAILEKETASGYGPKAREIKASIEGIDTKLSAIDSKVDALGEKVEGKQAESLEVTELSVFAKEFGLDANLYMKVMIGIFLTLLNALGFWLVYLADAEKVAVVIVPVVAKQKAKVKRVAKPKKAKEPMVERVVLGADELPSNVIQFPRDMVG